MRDKEHYLHFKLVQGGWLACVSTDDIIRPCAAKALVQ